MNGFSPGTILDLHQRWWPNLKNFPFTGSSWLGARQFWLWIDGDCCAHIGVHGAVITIQTVYNLVNPLVPMSAVGIVARDSIILEFSPTMMSLVLAGKIGSSIASEIGTMRVTEQIDALEIIGINSFLSRVAESCRSYSDLSFVVSISMFLGIFGGWFAGTMAGVISSGNSSKGFRIHLFRLTSLCDD